MTNQTVVVLRGIELGLGFLLKTVVLAYQCFSCCREVLHRPRTSLLLVAKHLPCQQGAEDAKQQVTKPGQLAQAGQGDISYHILLCSAIRNVGKEEGKKEVGDVSSDGEETAVHDVLFL